MKLNEMNYVERQDLNVLLENWLGMYTDEVIARVMNRLDEIVSNDYSMRLLRELRDREDKEKIDRVRSFDYLVAKIEDGEELEVHPIHLHTLTHSKSYRDVLYDMYIRD